MIGEQGLLRSYADRLTIYADRHTVVQQSLDRADGMRCAAGAIPDCRQIARSVATPCRPLV